MALAPPPSYQEATSRADWLPLVAPYISPPCYTNLCLVSKRFYRQFAPVLWNDPITLVPVIRPNLEDGEFVVSPLLFLHLDADDDE